MRFAFLTLALLTVAMTACGDDDAGTSLIDTEWTLTELDGAAPIPDTGGSILFTAEGVSGSTGCNTFSGGYVVDDDGSLTIGPNLATTRMACVDDVMAQELAFLELVPSATRYEIVGDTLSLYDGDDVVAVFSA